MKALFDRYVNARIGLNYHTAYHIDEATLTLAAETYFAAVGGKDGVTHYYPYSAVIHVMEKEGGVEVGDLQRRMLETIEQQALYILQLEERVKRLEAKSGIH